MTPIYQLQMHVLADPFMPARVRVKWPKKGPYYQRRVKRTAGDPGNYRWPEKPFAIFGGDVILCHPDYLPILKETLRKSGVVIA